MGKIICRSYSRSKGINNKKDDSDNEEMKQGEGGEEYFDQNDDNEK